VCQSAERLAQTLKRPFTYLTQQVLSKEDLALKIAERDHKVLKEIEKVLGR
jgi:hypothetical protein